MKCTPFVSRNDAGSGNLKYRQGLQSSMSPGRFIFVCLCVPTKFITQKTEMHIRIK